MRTLFILCLALFSVSVCFAQSETQLNTKYHNDILAYIREDLQKTEKQINKQAAKILVALPNEQKLYNETMVHIKLDVAEGVKEDGAKEYNLVYTITYDCKHIEGVTDDYPTGVYDWNSSNSCRAICKLTKTMVEGELNKYFSQNRDVTIRLLASTDGVHITKVNYLGEYGDFRYCPMIFNGEEVRISVSQDEGITTNAQLGFVRAHSIKDFFEKNVPLLKRDNNVYEFSSTNHERQGGRFRRSSIELVVHGAFDNTVEQMNAKLQQDEYVDFNIPEVEPGSNKNTFALIIANEEYPSPLPAVPYALNDGKVFMQYCLKTLGIPERHVKLLANATESEIRYDAIKWVKDITVALPGEANVIIYFAGHGTTDDGFKPYLIPCDVKLDKIKSLVSGKQGPIGVEQITLSKSETKNLLAQCLSIDTICGWFKKVQTKSITIIVDASCNGTQRNGSPLFVNKNSASKYKAQRIKNDILLMSASGYNSTAYSFEDQHHGFFTYFLLKELKRTSGDITLEELFNNIDKQLSYESSLQGKLQKPEVSAGGKIKDVWQSQRLR